MKLSKAIVKLRVPIVLLTLVLMIPAFIFMLNTRINYDMLTYLPESMDTVKGQNILMDEFGKGAFSFIILEDMPDKDVAALKEKVEQVEQVDSVLWYNNLADISVPKEFLPDKVYNAFNTDHSTVMAVFFKTSTSSDETMDAIREIRSVTGEKCFVCGLSALVTDLKDLCEKEEPIYVGIAVILALIAMILLLDNWLIPLVFLAIQRLNRQIHKRYHKVWPKWDESNAVLHDVLNGINVIKTFGTEDRETKRYADASLEYNNRIMRADVFWFEVFPFMTFFITIGEFFVLLFGGLMVLEGALTLGKLVQFTVYVGYLYVPMRWWVRLPQPNISPSPSCPL